MNYAQRERPLGITILTIVFAASTFMLLWALTRLPSSGFGAVLTGMEEFGIQRYRFIIESTFQITLIIACCVGLWMGKQWGWWLTMIFWTYTLAVNVNSIRQLPMLAERTLIPRDGLLLYFVRQNLLAIRDILILLYMFKQSVLKYFDLSTSARWKLLLTVVSITVGLVVILNLV